MCEICEQLKEMGRIEGEIIGEKRGYTNGKIETMKETAANLLMKKLGYLSSHIVIKINGSNEDELNELIINVFDIEKEEDIFKYI